MHPTTPDSTQQAPVAGLYAILRRSGYLTIRQALEVADTVSNHIRAALALHPSAAPAQSDAYGYARRLAEAIHARHYPEVTQWEPFQAPDVLGVLTQIDNMTSGLVRATPTPGAAPATTQPDAAPVAGPKGITLDFKQATELLEMFGGEPGEITLSNGTGHCGDGLYAWYSELPEEGAEYLGKSDDEAAPAMQGGVAVAAKQPDSSYFALPHGGSSASEMALLVATWMASVECEDCSGTGHKGELIYQGEFQPPEADRCVSCNGTGCWKVEAFSREDLDKAMTIAYAEGRADEIAAPGQAEPTDKGGV